MALTRAYSDFLCALNVEYTQRLCQIGLEMNMKAFPSLISLYVKRHPLKGANVPLLEWMLPSLYRITCQALPRIAALFLFLTLP